MTNELFQKAASRTLQASILLCMGMLSMTTPALAQSTGVVTNTTLGTPTITNVDIAGCNGAYNMQWTAVSGATYYQVFSKAKTATTYTLYRSPTGTNARIVVNPNGVPFDFEVQACNGSSCGAFSAPIELSGYSGCP